MEAAGAKAVQGQFDVQLFCKVFVTEVIHKKIIILAACAVLSTKMFPLCADVTEIELIPLPLMINTDSSEECSLRLVFAE